MPPGGRTVFQGKRVEVRVVDQPLPGGGVRQRDLMLHPGSVVILAVTDRGEVVLERNRRYALDGWLLELPAGTLEPPGEDPLACARRELREETGYEARDWTPLGRFYCAPGYCNELQHIFLARGLTQVGRELDDGEEIEVRLVPVDQLRRDAREGRLEDAKTLAALLLAEGRI